MGKTVKLINYNVLLYIIIIYNKMVQAIINLGERENRFLNIFKAKKGIKSKTAALNIILQEYEDFCKREELKEQLDNIVKEHSEQYSNRTMSLDDIDKLL